MCLPCVMAAAVGIDALYGGMGHKLHSVAYRAAKQSCALSSGLHLSARPTSLMGDLTSHMQGSCGQCDTPAVAILIHLGAA